MGHLTTSQTNTATASIEQTEVRQRAEQAPTDEAREHQPTPRPLTAAQRGPEWMNRWGCPGFCVEEHGQPTALEAHSTAPIETLLRAADVDCSGYSSNGEAMPWLSAQVVVKD